MYTVAEASAKAKAKATADAALVRAAIIASNACSHIVRLVYGACVCHIGQKAMTPATCMLRVCTYACAVIDMSFFVLYGISLSI